MNFNILNGNELNIDDSLMNKVPNFTVQVMDEMDGSLILKDNDGLTSNFPKNLLVENDLKIIGNILELSDTLYDHWFGEEKKCFLKMKVDEEKDLFKQNFKLIYENRDIVFSKGEYFLIRIPSLLYTGSSLFGKHTFCLGSLFESWERSDDLFFFDPDSKSKILMTSIGGSHFSGRHWWQGWSISREEFISGRNSSMKLYDKFEKLSERYPMKLSSSYGNISKLLRKINKTH